MVQKLGIGIGQSFFNFNIINIGDSYQYLTCRPY